MTPSSLTSVRVETPPAELPLPARALRSVARAVFRDDYWRVQVGITERLHTLRWRRSALRPVTDAYVDRFGLRVRTGPFAGTTFPPEAVGFVDALTAKLLGTYEQELRAAVERVIGADHDLLVNIGCADGLYAVGLARRSPGLRVVAFDLLPTARRLARALARENGVLDRFTFHAEADVETLRALDARNPVVIADCEGCEVALLDPELVPWLRSATILVELHDFLEDSASTVVPGRFADTHDVEIVDARPRYVLDHPEVLELPVSPMEQEFAICEFRPTRMQWAVIRPRTPAAP